MPTSTTTATTTTLHPPPPQTSPPNPNIRAPKPHPQTKPQPLPPPQVDDLRKYLRALGLSAEGSRYTLRDRLVTMLVVRKAASAGDMDHLLRQLGSVSGPTRLVMHFSCWSSGDG
jgi:hypothetical protein